jgi:uncharacterized membrane protein HdeD (DUF308 family)
VSPQWGGAQAREPNAPLPLFGVEWRKPASGPRIADWRLFRPPIPMAAGTISNGCRSTDAREKRAMTNQSFDALRDAVTGTIREHWKLFLAEGIILVILGFLAVAVPLIAGLAITIVLGWLFLISGIVGLITTWRTRHGPGFWWSLLSAVLGIVVGVSLLALPGLGLVSLTYVLIAFFIVEGVASIMYALEHRRQLTGRWGWMLTSGVIDLFLAFVIFAGLPGSLAWALGLIVGVNMIFGGASMIAMAFGVRSRPQ